MLQDISVVNRNNCGSRPTAVIKLSNHNTTACSSREQEASLDNGEYREALRILEDLTRDDLVTCQPQSGETLIKEQLTPSRPLLPLSTNDLTRNKGEI